MREKRELTEHEVKAELLRLAEKVEDASAEEMRKILASALRVLSNNIQPQY